VQRGTIQRAAEINSAHQPGQAMVCWPRLASAQAQGLGSWANVIIGVGSEFGQQRALFPGYIFYSLMTQVNVLARAEMGGGSDAIERWRRIVRHRNSESWSLSAKIAPGARALPHATQW
jgi:hypothetical protein